MAYVAANDLQYIAKEVDAEVRAAIIYLDLAPPQGDAIPQTHATASLTG